MTVQASAQQHVAQPDLKEDQLASHSTSQSMVRQQQEGSVAEGLSEAIGEQDRNVATATPAVGGTGVLIGVALIIVGVFVVGFMRKPIEQAVRRLSRRVVDSSYDINVPLLLPLAIAEAVRELLSERRGVFPPLGE